MHLEITYIPYYTNFDICDFTEGEGEIEEKVEGECEGSRVYCYSAALGRVHWWSAVVGCSGIGAIIW